MYCIVAKVKSKLYCQNKGGGGKLCKNMIYALSYHCLQFFLLASTVFLYIQNQLSLEALFLQALLIQMLFLLMLFLQALCLQALFLQVLMVRHLYILWLYSSITFTCMPMVHVHHHGLQFFFICMYMYMYSEEMYVLLTTSTCTFGTNVLITGG